MRWEWKGFISFFFQGFVVSLIEVFGLCYYTIAVLTLKELSSTELILFTNAIFMLPSLKNVINLQNRDPCSKVLSLITVMLNLGGIAWAIHMVNTVYIIIYIIYGDICPKYGQLDVAYTRLGCTVKLYCTLLYNYIIIYFTCLTSLEDWSTCM